MSTFPLGLPHLGVIDNASALTIQAAINGLAVGNGKVFYLDPVNGNDGNTGLTPGQAVATLAQGYALLTSGNNDVLVVIGNGAASGSVRINSFTWAKSACHMIGICAPSMISQRARIANPTTAGITLTANFFTVSGSGCLFQNLSWFHGASASQTGIAAAIALTVTGSRNAFINCDVEGMGDTTASADTGSRNIKITGTGGENYFSHCNIGLDTVVRTNANYSVELANHTVRNIFEDCTFLVDSGDGAQAIIYAGTGGLDRFVLLKRCTIINSVGSGATALTVAMILAASAGGILVFDQGSMLAGCTAIGDATTKAQTYVGGGTATNGVKGIVAT